MITNEIESFTCKNVLYADILGFSNLISKHRETADTVLTEFHGIIKDCFQESDGKTFFIEYFRIRLLQDLNNLKKLLIIPNKFSINLFVKKFL